MSSECIFCKIINKEIPATVIYEDDSFIAILDKFPSAYGHTLVIPKMHEENIFSISENTSQNILEVVKNVSLSLKKMGFDNINLIQNNGEIAGQTVNHFHIHVIPRVENDKIKLSMESNIEADEILLEIKDEMIKNWGVSNV